MADNAGGGAVCFQTLLQPVRMAHPYNLSQPSRVCNAIFSMQVAKGCECQKLRAFDLIKLSSLMSKTSFVRSFMFYNKSLFLVLYEHFILYIHFPPNLHILGCLCGHTFLLQPFIVHMYFG